MTHLTAIVLTYNESKHISACLETLAFADARLVFDSFSADETVELARQAGAEVIQHEFENYAAQRNAALDAVADKTDYVLFVDADERVTPELRDEVLHVIATGDCAGWRIPRHNYLFGKLTLGAGWFPDYQTRLLKVGQAHYDPERTVHEVVLLDGAEGTLKNPFIHYNYDHVAQFRAKQRKYLRYEAQILYEQGIKPKVYTPLTQPLRHFYWRFITLKGYRDGFHGFRLSALMAWYELRKTLLLGQMWRNKNGTPEGIPR